MKIKEIYEGISKKKFVLVDNLTEGKKQKDLEKTVREFGIGAGTGIPEPVKTYSPGISMSKVVSPANSPEYEIIFGPNYQG